MLFLVFKNCFQHLSIKGKRIVIKGKGHRESMTFDSALCFFGSGCVPELYLSILL